MGNNICKSDGGMFSVNSQKFWKEVQGNVLNTDAKEKVKLNISIKKSLSKAYKVTFLRTERGTCKAEGETVELKPQEGVVNFPNAFIMDYYFEKQQLISFNVKCGGSVHEVKTTLGKIMGSRKQLFQHNLPGGEIFEVQGQGIKGNTSSFATFTASIKGGTFKNRICFVIKNCGTQNAPSNTLLYKSEALKGDILDFTSISIPTTQITSNNDYAESMIGIEVYNCKSKKQIGESTNSLVSFLGNESKINLSEGGSLEIKCKIHTKPGFLDYLKGGTQIALTIGIDFTGSNGIASSYSSLHYIKNQQLNSYEKAIKACGDIVAHYDYDQLFPVYGYGACPTASSGVSHCFPLTGKDDPNIHTINGVLQVYREKVPQMVFSGPTNFAPLMREFLNNVIEEKAKNKYVYNILMILTDGQINDMRDTVNEVVRASFEPVSIIIIGIGDGPFGNMDILDADDNPLLDSNKRKAARDLVQFVPFSKFQNNGEYLAEEVLEEVPKQVCEYYEINKIIPGDPIVNIK